MVVVMVVVFVVGMRKAADHVVLMDAGCVLQSGPAAAVLARLAPPAGGGKVTLITATVREHDALGGMTTLLLDGVPVRLPDTTARTAGEVVQLRLQIGNAS